MAALSTTDVVARAAVVEGYNSNTYQAQDDPSTPTVRRHPSPFTGTDAVIEFRFLGRDSDVTTVLVGGRYNHYEPLNHDNQSDDGAFNALLSSRLTLWPRTTLSIAESASVTSFNAAHATDGTIFAFDPTLLRSTYWVDDASVGIAHHLSPRWRLDQSIGATVSGTIDSAPILLAGGPLVRHRGLDYLMPYVETDLNHELSPRSSGDLTVLYEYAYQLFVLDFTRTPPRNIGPDKQAFLSLRAGYTYHFSSELSGVVHGGAELASAPPRDPDQRAVLSPTATGDLYYSRPFFDLVASAGYTWGTVNPRLGSGPSATASVLAKGIPHPVGRWKDLALIGAAQLAYSSLVTGVSESTNLGLYSAEMDVRYGMNNWLGLLGGYQVRYATFGTPTYTPPFMQHVVFLGLSGYWSTDRVQLPLTTFAAPVQPPA